MYLARYLSYLESTDPLHSALCHYPPPARRKVGASKVFPDGSDRYRHKRLPDVGAVFGANLHERKAELSRRFLSRLRPNLAANKQAISAEGSICRISVREGGRGGGSLRVCMSFGLRLNWTASEKTHTGRKEGGRGKGEGTPFKIVVSADMSPNLDSTRQKKQVECGENEGRGRRGGIVLVRRGQGKSPSAYRPVVACPVRRIGRRGEVRGWGQSCTYGLDGVYGGIPLCSYSVNYSSGFACVSWVKAWISPESGSSLRKKRKDVQPRPHCRLPLFAAACFGEELVCVAHACKKEKKLHLVY